MIETIADATIAAVAGAALGAFLNQRLLRATPIVLINSIELSTALVGSNEKVTNRDLLRDLKAFPYPLHIQAPSGSIKLASWLEYLSAFDIAIEDLLADIDETMSSVNRACELIMKEDFVAARPEIGSQHDLWHLIEEGYYRTQEEVFSPETSQRLDQIETTNGLVEIDDDNDIVVGVGDGGIMYFDWATFSPGSRRNAARTLAQRCALAIATNDKPALLEMLNYVQHEVPTLKNEAEKLRNAVRSVLSEYQHIVVTCLLINAGRLDYLVDSQARLVVSTKGYPRRFMRRGAVREEPLANDASLDMIVTTWSEEKESLTDIVQLIRDNARFQRTRMVSNRPRNVVPVSPGQPVVVRLISEARLNELEFSEQLTRIYDDGERQAYIILSMIKPRQTTPRAWQSTFVPFRNVTRQAALSLEESQ